MTVSDAASPFTLAYNPPTIRFGRDCIDRLAADLEAEGSERALVVCGRNVGANEAVMEPVRAGLGYSHAGTFYRTTPAKLVRTAYEGLERVRDADVDAIVAVGSGSSLDIAKAISFLAARDEPIETVVAEIEEDSAVASPPESATPIPTVAIPTTLAGADISTVCGVKTRTATEPPGDRSHAISGRIADERLMPSVLYYDPALFATTPERVLYGSAMNGFDKGIETLYSRSTNPVSDGCAVRGLQLLADALPELPDPEVTDALDRVVRGIVGVQYVRRTNVIHAFCHGVAYYYDVQQGVVHGILAPHVLRYVFDRVDGRRDLLADALGVERDVHGDAVATAVIDRVVQVRDALELPSRLRSIDGIERDHLPAIAATIDADSNHRRNPPGLAPEADDIEAVLREAW